MKQAATFLWVGLALAACLTAAGAEPAAKEDPAHEELRALRRELTQAINNNDLDKLLALLDDDVVVTFMNAEVARKPEQVKAYYERMMKGEHRIVDSFTTDPTVDELTHMYGDTGVAFGSSKDHFKLVDGRDFQVETRWTAVLVKKQDKWKVAGFHASASIFDNPVLYIAIRKTAAWTGGIAAVVGLVIGFAAAWFLKKRPQAA